MRVWPIVAMLWASPALAHHELILATSMLPFLGSIAGVGAAALLLFRRSIWRWVSGVRFR